MQPPRAVLQTRETHIIIYDRKYTCKRPFKYSSVQHTMFVHVYIFNVPYTISLEPTSRCIIDFTSWRRPSVRQVTSRVCHRRVPLLSLCLALWYDAARWILLHRPAEPEHAREPRHSVWRLATRTTATTLVSSFCKVQVNRERYDRCGVACPSMNCISLWTRAIDQHVCVAALQDKKRQKI